MEKKKFSFWDWVQLVCFIIAIVGLFFLCLYLGSM